MEDRAFAPQHERNNFSNRECRGRMSVPLNSSAETGRRSDTHQTQMIDRTA